MQNRPPENPCRLRVGTSGYSYSEWTAAGFYPPDTATDRMLDHYARIFPVTELNYTWYQMPSAPAMERMCAKTPTDFSISAKLTRTLTHEIDPNGWRGQAARYRDGIVPLIQARRLEAVLVQLPPSFDRSAGNRRYLAHLFDALEGMPLAVEFRNATWAADRVFAELERRRITLVTVDVPHLTGLFPTLDVVTNPELIYVRFHGRNARGWRSGTLQKQFDYDYSEAELRPWIDDPLAEMARQARRGVIVFNNHVRAQAPANARTLTGLLAQAGRL